MIRRPIMSNVLVCENCTKVGDEEARHWRAFLLGGDREANDVVVLCPMCAEREPLAD